MELERAQSADIAEDGHPCEAALEFRRAAVRSGLTEEVPADALDLAISMAWAGKAVSRTESGARWISTGTDPNTWQMVRAMAASPAAFSSGLLSAKEGRPAAGMVRELQAIRSSSAFRRAVEHLDGLEAGDARMAVLKRLAKRLPGSRAVPSEADASVVSLDDFRKSRGAG